MGTGLEQGAAPSTPAAELPTAAQWRLDSLGGLSGLRAGLRSAINEAAGRDEEVPLDDVPEHLALVATELATNALAHALPPTLVRLRTDGSTFVLEVLDHDLDEAPAIPDTRAPGQGGYGLLLAQRLAADVGWYRERSSKTVWALFTLPGVTPPLTPDATDARPDDPA
ncbi:ATP-binding protein [Cellulomonas marina]|uniref:Histidine kinase-like ATPase domain-containing protein n=1 Tax=Cellulomonas marina TaxID=988821 RepID=A0A1I1A956_9CELL|nr:ATP-binding protein [Cellulomonas marina]GIG29555.1 hypothetical protein Cma02nite_21550 [Cellulomonas marina]SFB32990.1 Histidine kinase-like ATPase domain-containing protein [Cellulomonas marina]